MRTQIRRQVSAALKATSGVLDRVRPPAPGVTVLIYHRVGARTPVPVDLPTPLFRDQMAELADRAISMDDALARLDGPAPAPGTPNPVVVTFDDGTADVVEEALPVLVEFGIPALLYVATDFVEQGRDFPDDGRVASWSALADARSTGCLELGSHTHTHALLDRLDASLVEDELTRSIELLRERTGATADHFAYPKALPGSPAADRLVRQHFRSAAIAGTRANRYGATDAWNLERSPIQVADGMRWFRAKAAGGLGLEDAVRRTVNRVRYRGATS
ncbi:MAG: polysaccharide deacetylase family protein [Acidimicrobiales bacterium]